MSHSKIFLVIFIFAKISLAANSAPSSPLKKEFQTLGDNKEVIERVKNMDNQQKIRVVQNRLVSRTNRIELAVDYGALFGADTYVKTSNFGAQLQYHLTPQWSFGVEFHKSYNKLTAEGQKQYDLAYTSQQQNSASTQRFAGVDFPLETQMATVSFYPIYGKMNLFDSAIAQFDLYTLFGYGKKKLNSGDTNVLAAGLGIGVWLNNYFTTRLEIRYENYKDLLNIEPRAQDSITAIASVGILVW